MTIPPLARLRLANTQDASDIYELINESMAKNFRINQVSDVINLIETSTLSIVQMNKKHAIVGFAAANDHPLLPSVHPSAWEHYIWTKYKAVEMTARNTLFLHLLCWSPLYERDVVDSLLKSMFMHDFYLMNIAMLKCQPKYPLLMPGQSRCEGSFRRVTSAERGVPTDIIPVMFLAERVEVCRRLRVRRAVEEDNDDLVPIIDQHSTRLRELYGEFYISELISRHPESERVLLVGERAELAVGVMILNTMINYEALEESFDLSPFAGLRKLDANPVRQYFSMSSDVLDCLDEKTDGRVKQISPNVVLPTNPTRTSSGKVEPKKFLNFDDDVLSAEDVDVVELPMVEDDDDLVEYDIVNISHELMRIPRPLSVELNIIFEQTGDETITIKDVTSAPNQEQSDCRPNTISPGEQGRSRKMFDIIRYSGAPNAFLLEVFAMHPDYDERYGYDILQTAYEMFPDRDYCVLCIPSEQPAFPLLEHFTLVAPRCYREKYINQSLYVAHVNSVREYVAVRKAEAYDFPSMTTILEHMADRQHVMDLLQKSLVSDDLDAYVLLSQRQPVGVVILGTLDNCVGVRSQYYLEPQPAHPGTDGAIIAGMLSPALEPHARWYLRDLIRQSKFYKIFWPSQFVKSGCFSSRSIMSLAGRMVPVVPYRHSVSNILHNNELHKMISSVTNCALWKIERHLTAIPKVDVNKGIVVVGASRTGLAFIEALIMGRTSHYLTFTNITLVSECGLKMLSEVLPAAETCFPRSGRYTDRYLRSIPMNYYVDCITGVVVEINRKQKFIRLQSGKVTYYDELVLTCGQQFQHPDFLAESFAHSKKMDKGTPCERMLMDNPKYKPDKVPPRPELPENVFIINSVYEANICLRRLMAMIHQRRNRLDAENRVIVYGDHHESYSTIAALLEMGVAPKEIAFVEPFPPLDRHALRVNCFNDEQIDNRVQESLKKLGIYVYRQCHFVGWRMVGPRIFGLNVMAPLHSIFIPCFALFYYGLKAINYYAFKAINECGLVYDGGVVVDPKFKTNDAHVYAAGTFVNYSRRLRAEKKLPRHRSSEDVGEALANIFLWQMDPFVMADKDLDHVDYLPRYKSSLLNCFNHPSIAHLNRPSLEKNRTWEPVMEFESPVVQEVTFPGPLYYLQIKPPGIDLPMEVRLTLPHQGHLLTTDKNDNYFELRLNEFHCIDRITCLSKIPPCVDTLSQLHGIHESMFNHMLARYMMNKIEDFYEFFKQPWMSPMFLASFGTLLRLICQQNVGTVYDLIKSHFTLTGDDRRFSEKRQEPVLEPSNKSSSDSILSRYSEPSCIYCSGDAPNLGTVLSVFEKFIPVSLKEVEKTHIPSECGQASEIRSDARGFWNALGGERIVNAHLAHYLDRYRMLNTQYATIRPDLL